MLIHIVCWKYKADTPDSAKEDHRARLRSLKGIIEDVLSLDVGADILHLDRSFDTGLVAVFTDREGLDRYTDHPEHQKVVVMGRELSQQVVSVDFMNE